MAGSVNKVILVGHLGGDPEIKALPSGSTMAKLSVATSESWTDKASGQKQERTEWHKVVVMDPKLAQICERYLSKGQLVYIEGSIQTRSWLWLPAGTISNPISWSGTKIAPQSFTPDHSSSSTMIHPVACC